MSTNSKEKQREYSEKYRKEHPEEAQAQTRKGKQKFYTDHRARGLCIECSNPAEEGGSRCSQCLERRRVREVQRKQENAANGRCRECSEVAINGHQVCLKCYMKIVSNRHLGTRTRWREILELFERQNGKCALSGLPLTLGLNADLDHIVPRSRGGDNDLSNLQWVLEKVNEFKNNSLESEFFSFIEALYLTMKNK
jgi:5-methylcytosine-specific restriction endonuclease McrA